MSKMKYRFLVLLMMLALCLSACGKGGQEAGEKDSSGKLKIVTTIFPLYDWTREILGDQAENAELTLLLDKGVDLHSFQPTAQDILKISSCDVFVYVGGESDLWVEDALKNATNPDLQVVNLMEALGDLVKEEEVAEGMEEEEHDHDHEEDHEHEEGPEYDEHIWLSVKNAKACCDAIAGALAAADADHKEAYEKNLAAYQEKLEALDQEFQETVDQASGKVLLFGDRFPFRYLTEDYGLTYYAAFVGCSAETEASFQTIIFLAGKVDEEQLKSICKLTESDGSIARTIKEATAEKNQEFVDFDSMQSTDLDDVKAGSTYLTIMETNREALGKALGE